MQRIFIALFLTTFFQFQALARSEVNLSFTQPKNAPYFIGAPEINIDAEEFTTVILKMKSNQSGTARLFWATNFDPQMNEPKSLTFTFDKSAYLKEYVFNLKRQNPYWTGFIGQLLVYPENGLDGIEIGPSQAVVGNLGTNISSGWQEFFTFERPLPRTINFIYGPKINGISVNIYIYSLIILISLLLIVIYWIKFNDPGKLLNIIPSKIIMICFIFWLLLDARTAIDQLRSVIINHQTFGGKSLEEKQALSTNGGFYDFYYFLKFCGEKIPSGSTYSLVVPSHAIYFIEKSRYYLYPTYESTLEAGYVLVYDPQRMLKENEIPKNGLKKFADYGNNRYVLKRTAGL